jgi:hypothetical protein
VWEQKWITNEEKAVSVIFLKGKEKVQGCLWFFPATCYVSETFSKMPIEEWNAHSATEQKDIWAWCETIRQ